jgi:predicted nicotinamide N-methyase
VSLSIYACNAEEANITLTDQKPLLPLIKQNMEHNVENIPQLARVSVEEYNWGEETSMKDINLIICSDCVYDMAPWDLLVDSLRLLCCGEDSRILISMEHRYRNTEEKFFNYASQHFDIHTIPRVRLGPPSLSPSSSSSISHPHPHTLVLSTGGARR